MVRTSEHDDLRDSILEALQSSAMPLSGEQIAHDQGVSRAAVWKCIEELREHGVRIEAKPRRGYQLAAPGDYLTKAGILSLLPDWIAERMDIAMLPCTESTNDDAKRWARDGAHEFSVVLADEQTKGKGRRGKSFASPAGTGVYLSIVLRPEMSIPDTTVLTALAGVAVCRALEETTDARPAIKWVNDVYLGTRKVCGILTEGEVDFESGELAWAVVGIGINVYDPCIDGDVDSSIDIGHLFDLKAPERRNAVAAKVIEEFASWYTTADPEQVIEQYRRLSNLMGLKVVVKQGRETDGRQARVKGIADDLGLEVAFDDGETCVLRSGDVSITPLWDTAT